MHDSRKHLLTKKGDITQIHRGQGWSLIWWWERPGGRKWEKKNEEDEEVQSPTGEERWKQKSKEVRERLAPESVKHNAFMEWRKEKLGEMQENGNRAKQGSVGCQLWSFLSSEYYEQVHDESDNGDARKEMPNPEPTDEKSNYYLPYHFLKLHLCFSRKAKACLCSLILILFPTVPQILTPSETHSLVQNLWLILAGANCPIWGDNHQKEGTRVCC